MTLRLAGSTSGYTEIDAPAVAGSNTLVLPTGNGTNGQALLTNGAGVLSWGTPTGSDGLYYRLNSDLAGANVTTAQSIFGVGVTLAASTVYAFEGHVSLVQPSGTTAHQISLAIGGTATVNNILYVITGLAASQTSAAFPDGNFTTASTGFMANNTVASTFITANAITGNPSTFVHFTINGTVSINASGTFVPQYVLSAAPGAAYSTIAGSFIRFRSIGTAGSNSSSGTWS